MENTEKDLEKVSGGQTIEGKDGKFYVVKKAAIGEKALESKDGKFFVITDDTLSFDTKEQAKWNDKESLQDKLNTLPWDY